MFNPKEYEEAYVRTARLLGMQTRTCHDNLLELWVQHALPTPAVSGYWAGAYKSEIMCALEFARVYNYSKTIREALDAQGTGAPDEYKDHVGISL